MLIAYKLIYKEYPYNYKRIEYFESLYQNKKFEFELIRIPPKLVYLFTKSLVIDYKERISPYDFKEEITYNYTQLMSKNKEEIREYLYDTKILKKVNTNNLINLKSSAINSTESKLKKKQLIYNMILNAINKNKSVAITSNTKLNNKIKSIDHFKKGRTKTIINTDKLFKKINLNIPKKSRDIQIIKKGKIISYNN